MTKSCTQCGVEKDLTEFYNRKAECKCCSIERSKRWIAENPERVREWRRTSPKHKECQRRAKAKLSLDPEYREKAREKSREWRANNRERHRAQVKKWQADNKQRVRIYKRDHVRRRRLGVKGEDAAYAQILRGDPCSYCGASAGQVDHIIPVAAGGSNEWENLTSACAICNTFKSAEPSLLAFILRRPSVPAEMPVR